MVRFARGSPAPDIIKPDARRCPIASSTGTIEPRRWPWRWTLALVAVSYLACASVATFPVVLSFGSAIPGELPDPLEHLWILRWSKACLEAGRSPFFCPDLNYPTGVPLGYFPTMHLQTAAYLLMGLVTENDVACFNTLWFFGFVSTGLGTFLLAWWTTQRFWPSWLGGLGMMLCGPMLMHSRGHLETMQMGAVPLFLIAWLRFVDRPGWARLGSAVGLYLLVVACAPYFAVLAVFPAAWYVAWSVVFGGAGDRRAWLLGRLGWLVGFVSLGLPGLAALFSGQIWAARHGFVMARPRSQFNFFGAPPWSSFVPSPLHVLGKIGTPDLFAATGYSSRLSECSSYLGVVTLGLLAYAAFRRIRFPRVGYWWSALALMVVLSWGSEWRVGAIRISLPAGWIYGVFPPFHLIRVPARFNLFASVCAAVLASVALKDLLGRIESSSVRASLIAAFLAMSLVDLSMAPFQTSIIPPMPAVYGDLIDRNPERVPLSILEPRSGPGLTGSGVRELAPALNREQSGSKLPHSRRGAERESADADHPPKTLVDAPMFGSSQGQAYSSLWGYWQSFHHARTTAGYPGLPNVPFEAEIVRPSPWWAGRLTDPNYLAGPGLERFGAAEGVDPRDYAWLYLTAHKFDHVVLHQGRWIDPKYSTDRIKALLAEAKVFEDDDVALFDRDRLQAPQRLTWLCGEGFRPNLNSRTPTTFGVLREARIVVFNPSADRPLSLSLVGASAFGRSRVVRLVEGSQELGRWTIEPSPSQALKTAPIVLKSGIHELRLISHGDDKPNRYSDRLDDARTPYSLRLEAVKFEILGR